MSAALCEKIVPSERPLAIDLFTGLHGWAEGLVAAGFRVVGFDLEDMCGKFGMPRPDHVQLVIQDVTTLQGARFADAALIVASPPCQCYSYMAMPWTRAKRQAAEIRADASGAKLTELNRLFDACFRIQREACEAAGQHIPMVVENVRGAQPWVGRSRWSYGSYHLWGDVPALMPMTKRIEGVKIGGLDWSKHGEPGYAQGPGRCFRDSAIKNTGGSCFAVAHNTTSGHGRNPVGRNDPRDDVKVIAHLNQRDGHRSTAQLANPDEHIKQGGDWFGDTSQGSLRNYGSKSSKRKLASAVIAKIPRTLSEHIGRVYFPRPTKQRRPWPE